MQKGYVDFSINIPFLYLIYERLPDYHALLDGHEHGAVGDAEGIVELLNVCLLYTSDAADE